MKIGVVLSVFGNLNIEVALEKVAKLGYESVEISVENDSHHLKVDDVLNGGNSKHITNLVKSFGLSISALGNHKESQLVLGPYGSDTDLIFYGSPEEKINFGTTRIIRTAQLASEMEVPIVCGFCGCEDYSRWFPWPDPNGWEKMSPIFVDRWGKILDSFRKYGVKFAHECHPKQFAYNTETALMTVELLDNRPEWGFNLDPANLMLSGVDPVYFVQALGDRVLHVHAKDGEIVPHNFRKSGLLAHGDWKRIDRGFRFRIPGWGDIPWKKLITELKLVNYDYVMAVENEDATMGGEEGITKSLDYLKPLLIQSSFDERWW
jgi:sugar phosphate isomerase/epimerase